jgi:hypothetical protein
MIIISLSLAFANSFLYLFQILELMSDSVRDEWRKDDSSLTSLTPGYTTFVPW